MSDIPLSRDRVQFDDTITKSDIKNLLKNDMMKVLQTSSATSIRTFQLLDKELFANRPDVQLRLYGYYGNTCDLSVCQVLGNVKKFSADCLIGAVNISQISELKNVSELGVGIYEIENFDFLQHVNQDIQSLSLMASFSKKPKINLIERFSNLQRLYLEGQQNGIEKIATLQRLTEVTLRSISTKSLSYLEPLTKLQSVDIKLGGISTFESLNKLPNLRYLEIWQVRKFTSLDFLAELESLQYLYLQSLPLVSAFPKMNKLGRLRRVYIENLKSLHDFSGLALAPNLHEFIIAQAAKQEVTDMIPVLNMPSIKAAAGYFGSKGKNEMFDKLLLERDLVKYKNKKFVFE